MSVHVDISDVLEGMNSMSKAARNLQKPFRALRPQLAKDISEHSKKRQGPDGPWPAWSASYQERRRRKRKRGKMLGRLVRLKYTITADKLEGKPFVEWAGVHQWGGVVGHGARIPARMFAYASDAMVATAREAILNHVMGGWTAVSRGPSEWRQG